MQLTKTIIRIGIPVQIAVVASAVAVMTAIAVITAPIMSNFVISTTTTTFNCTDTDGGKNFAVKGTVKVMSASSNFTMADSCKSVATLNELFCDPVRKYANVVTQNCVGGCSNGVCLKAATSTVMAPTVAFLSANSSIIPGDENIDAGEFKIEIKITNNGEEDIWIDKDQAVQDGTPMPAGFYGTTFKVFKNGQLLNYSSSSAMGFLTPRNWNDKDSLYGAFIAEGESRNFTLYVSVVPMVTGIYNVALSSIRWDINSDNNTEKVISGALFDQFKTNPIMLGVR